MNEFFFYDKILSDEDVTMDFKKILFKTSTIDVERSLPDAIVFVSKDGKIQWVNDVAADILETSKMHLMTSDISEFIEAAQVMINSALSLNHPVIVKLNGKENYYDMTAREIEEGYVLDLRDTVQDIKNVQKEEDTGIINREKNNFLLKLANDIKSPIQSIVGFSQAISDGLGGKLTEQQEKYIKVINKNSSDLMYFMAKVIELSQTESFTKEPDKKPFDIVALVNSTVRYNEQLYKDKELKIFVKQDDEFKKTITSDSDIIKGILQNILEVVFKSVDMGEVLVNLSNPDEDFLQSKNLKNGNYTLISISSSSLFLSESDKESIFDPYKIIDSSNRKNVLRAIVLASARNLAKSLNGIIWAEAKVLKNTTFNILIPES